VSNCSDLLRWGFCQRYSFATNENQCGICRYVLWFAM